MESIYSIQVTNWITNEIVCFINSGFCAIFDVIFNPYDKNQLVTCGFQSIVMWSIQGRSLSRHQIVQIESNNIITGIQFISYNLGNIIQSDLICANSKGDMSIVAHGKYIMVK